MISAPGGDKISSAHAEIANGPGEPITWLRFPVCVHISCLEEFGPAAVQQVRDFKRVAVHWSQRGVSRITGFPRFVLDMVFYLEYPERDRCEKNRN